MASSEDMQLRQGQGKAAFDALSSQVQLSEDELKGLATMPDVEEGKSGEGDQPAVEESDCESEGSIDIAALMPSLLGDDPLPSKLSKPKQAAPKQAAGKPSAASS